MNKLATMQDSWASESDPAVICSFDYEAIQKPTKALIHQAARFLYIKHGKGKIVIDGAEYDIVPNMLIAITPWKITDVTEVEESLQFLKVIYDYSYINAVLKGVPGSEEESSELLRFMSMEPVAYLDSIQAQQIDELMEQLKAELGVESTRLKPSAKPFTQLYTTNKLIELMIVYRRYIMSARGEKDCKSDPAKENSILSYIYAHSSDKLTLTSVAEVFFISESTLSKASDYLIYTDMTLDEIANLVGFVDASHISKHFVSKVGVTPMNYRKIYSKAASKYTRSTKDIAFAVTDYLYKNYETEKLTASHVASQFGVSVTELNRLLLYYSEKNFETLLNFIRINKACELLASTEYLVIDVAVAVGYSNVKTFNMNFLKCKEMTPTEFRNRITLQKADGSEATGQKSTNRRSR